MTARRSGMMWLVPLSLLLHAVTLAVLVVIKPLAIPPPVEERPISVEIVSLPSAEKQPVPEVNAQPSSGKARPALTADQIIATARKLLPKPARKTTDPNALIAARQLYSAAALADRRSAKARAALRSLSPDERIIQLCDVEAMEQVHRWKVDFAPDLVVAYATADIKLSAHDVDAGGAAIHSRGNWFAMRFRCNVSADGATVVAFAFRVGEAIPRDRWQDYSLAANVEAAD